MRENNLKGIDLKIPKRKITVFTGVSGSGKSSLVFDTIGREAKRQLNETFSTYIRNRLPKYGQPDADRIENLSPAVVIDQKRLGGNSRSTVGTITDIFSLLRLLFSRVGQPYVGEAKAFSFNEPEGMCTGCAGVGKWVDVQMDKLFDRSKSLNEGAILFSTFGVGSWYWQKHLVSGLSDADKKLADFSSEEWQMLLYGSEQKVVLPLENERTKYFEEVVSRFRRLYLKKEMDQQRTKDNPLHRIHAQLRFQQKVKTRVIDDFDASQMETASDGSLRVKAGYYSLEEAVQHILSSSTHVMVESPVELVDELQQRIAEMAQLYSKNPRNDGKTTHM